MKRIVVLFLCLIFSLIGYPQRKSLIPGEQLSYTKKLGLAKGEKVILDLFSSNCVVCFKMMPKTDSLQRVFAGKMKFILVGLEDGRIQATYEFFRKKFGLEFTTIFDSVFFKQYQLHAFPTYVWLDENHVIKAVTGPDAITTSNITRFTNGADLSNLSENKTPFDVMEPFLLLGNGGEDSSYLFRSLLSKWNTSLPYFSPLRLGLMPNRNFVNILGVSMGRLYNYAYYGYDLTDFWWRHDTLYGNVYPVPILADERSVDSVFPERYCYSLSTNFKEANLQKILRNDLDNYFGYKVSIEKRMMPCYKVKVAPATAAKMRSAGGKQDSKVSHASFEIVNTPFRRVMDLIHRYAISDKPYIDETGIDFPVDFKLTGAFTDRADFFRALSEAGIEISDGMKELKVMILSKTD